MLIWTATIWNLDNIPTYIHKTDVFNFAILHLLLYCAYYCKKIIFCWISILWFSSVENSLDFNLVDFPVDFVKQFVSVWLRAIPKIRVFNFSNHENLILAKCTCLPGCEPMLMTASAASHGCRPHTCIGLLANSFSSPLADFVQTYRLSKFHLKTLHI